MCVYSPVQRQQGADEDALPRPHTTIEMSSSLFLASAYGETYYATA